MEAHCWTIAYTEDTSSGSHTSTVVAPSHPQMVQYIKKTVVCNYYIHHYFNEKRTTIERNLPWGWVRVRMAKAPPNLLCMLQL
jgi:hypothetical protein